MKCKGCLYAQVVQFSNCRQNCGNIYEIFSQLISVSYSFRLLISVVLYLVKQYLLYLLWVKYYVVLLNKQLSHYHYVISPQIVLSDVEGKRL